jgi:hypothetical protein
MTSIIDNYNNYKERSYDYNKYFKNLLTIMKNDKNYKNTIGIYEDAFETAFKLGPQRKEEEMNEKMFILMILDEDLLEMENNIDGDYGEGYYYKTTDEEQIDIENSRRLLQEVKMHDNHDEYKDYFGGSRRNKATPKPKAKPKAKPQHEDMTMKDIKELCKANLIKLSKVVEGKRVVYKKKELITKLKRKKLL